MSLMKIRPSNKSTPSTSQGLVGIPVSRSTSDVVTSDSTKKKKIKNKNIMSIGNKSLGWV